MGMEVGEVSEVLYDIRAQDSIFAVIVQPEGLASILAHQHLIHADPKVLRAELKLAEDTNNVELLRFSIRFPTESLLVDVPEMKDKWLAAIKEAGIMQTDWRQLSESDRKKVREVWLSSSANIHTTMIPMC